VTWTQLAGEIRQDIPILMVMNLIDPYFDCSLFPVFVVKSPAESLPNVKYQPNETLHIGSYWIYNSNLGPVGILLGGLLHISFNPMTLIRTPLPVLSQFIMNLTQYNR
jgi:hypothetical protein